MKRLIPVISLLVFVLAFSGPAIAGEKENAKIFYNKVCSGCHGVNGVVKHHMHPSLSVLPKAYVRRQLLDFTSGARSNGHMMPRLMKHYNLSKERIGLLANYIDSLGKK